jgi:hypothetical protein
MEQSDFSVVRAADVELPATAARVALPNAPDSSAASELATRWVLRIAMVLLAALALLCVVGLHIPSGE